MESDALHRVVVREMKLTPNIALMFNGECEAAFKTYAQCLEGAITYMMTWGESPMAGQLPPGWERKIYHATLTIGTIAINGSDPFPDQYQQPQGFSMILQMDDPDVAERVFNGLSEQGRVAMPLQQTFWAKRFAVVEDRYGISWTINCE